MEKRLRPKVSSDNELFIHPIKDSWTREEILTIVTQAAEQTNDCECAGVDKLLDIVEKELK